MTDFDGMTLVQTSTLPDINDVPPLAADDEACLAEVKGVLLRHGKQTRFGVALLHKHFELDNDELLVEHCDTEQRILTTRPKKIAEVDGQQLVKTVFAFDPSVERNCEPYCPTDAKGRHQGRKDH